MATDPPRIALASLLHVEEADIPFVTERELEDVLTNQGLLLKDRYLTNLNLHDYHKHPSCMLVWIQLAHSLVVTNFS